MLSEQEQEKTLVYLQEEESDIALDKNNDHRQWINSIVAGTPVVATNDANAVTGNQSPIWGGANPTAATGVTGNVAAGVGLTNITTRAVFKNNVVEGLYSISCNGVLTAGQNNYLRTPLAELGIMGNKVVMDLRICGIYNPNATENNNTPTPSFISAVGRAFIIKDALFIEILAANIALYQNKIVNVEIKYMNKN